jgi:sortase A
MIFGTEQEHFAKRAQQFLHWTRRIFMLTGLLAICYVALTLLDARRYQQDAAMTLDKNLHSKEQLKVAQAQHAIAEGDLLGRIEIPRIGLSVAILQGTSSRTLRLGVGHIEGTALPGKVGNVGIAGHRDTFFRTLKDVRRNDKVLLQTASGVIGYEVDWIQITDPDDGGIVSSGSDSALTLVTCYPFRYIGAAPERYVVHAHRQ